ncbi:hypothetical protein ACET3Z_025227 [Daucus carota]
MVGFGRQCHFLSTNALAGAQNPGQVAAAAAAPIGVFIAVTGISIVAFPLRKILSKAILQALALGTAGAFLFDRCIRKQLGHLLMESSLTQPDPKDLLLNLQLLLWFCLHQISDYLFLQLIHWLVQSWV